MAKPLIVFADSSAEYIAPIECRLAENFADRVDLEIIDDPEYFRTFFSEQRRIDVLIIQETLYSQVVRRMDVGVTYLLSEEAASENLRDPDVKVLYRYGSLQKLFGEIEFGARPFVPNISGQTQKTKTVLVYSAAGGAGKTVIALGLCCSLVENHKRVLFLDAENLQDFAFYMRDKSPLGSSANAAFGMSGQELYSSLLPHLRCEGFDYLPPLRMAAAAMNIELSVYKKIIEEFKKHVAYDYIVVDTDSVFDKNKEELIISSDRVIIVNQPGPFGRYKTGLLLQNVAAVDERQFLFVTNRSAAMQLDEGSQGSSPQDAVIRTFPEPEGLASLRGNRDIEKLSYLL